MSLLCEECGHPVSAHGKYGCEIERGDAWVDGVSMGGWMAQGPCGCTAWEEEILKEEECNGNEKTEEAASGETTSGDTPETKYKTEVFYKHCPGCAASR